MGKGRQEKKIQRGGQGFQQVTPKKRAKNDILRCFKTKYGKTESKCWKGMGGLTEKIFGGLHEGRKSWAGGVKELRNR